MLFCCSSNLSDSTSQTQAPIVLFCFLCVCLCLCFCSWGTGGWLTFSASAQDRPINLSLWNAIIFEARRQNAHCQKVKYWTDDSSEESNRPLSAGRVAGCLCKLCLLGLGWNDTRTRVALFSLHAKIEAIWRGLVVLCLTRGVNTGWQHRTVDVVTITEERGPWGTNSRRNTTPSTFISSTLKSVDGQRETIHVSGATGFRNDSQTNGHDLTRSQSTVQCWLRKRRRELRHVPSSRKQFDDQNRCCVHRFKVFAARTFTFSHFGAFNVTALPW